MSILRLITEKATLFLETPEVILLIGPRQAGKTTILKQLRARVKEANQTFFFNLEDPDFLKTLNQNPKNLLRLFPYDERQRTIVFIDEIQYLDDPSHFLKYWYDEYQGKIKLVVSGSSAFYLDKKFHDSLAGRKKIFQVRTLSFAEFLRFKGRENLLQLQRPDAMNERRQLEQDADEYMTFGGYPRVVLAAVEEKKDVLQDIAYSYIKKDIYDAHIRSDQSFYQLLKILAEQTGQLTNASELASTLGLSKTSIDHYLEVMRKSFHLGVVRPFFRNLRKELTKMPKYYFFDLGLRNFLVNNFLPFERREDKGQVLENAVFRCLADVTEEEEIKFWRTKDKEEIDFIVNGTRALEVKVNPNRFKRKIFERFQALYPEVSCEIASFRLGERATAGITISEFWEL